MPVVEEISKITAKGQTTLPKMVRKVLGVDVGDQIVFRVEGSKVTVVTAGTVHEDPVVGKFLNFIAKDLERRPQAVKPLSPRFAARLSALARDEKVDLDAFIEGDVDL